MLYYYNTNSWAAQYYCEGYTATRWNVAEYCTGINCEESLKNNAHIHQLRLNSYVSCPPRLQTAGEPAGHLCGRG